MKIGLFICHCGKNIKDTVDIGELKEYFKNFPYIEVIEDYPFLCSEPGQDLIKNNIAKHNLDRVIIAACTMGLHEETFKDLMKKANLNPFLMKRVSIREHASWVGENKEKNTEKAIKMIKGGVYSVAHFMPLEEKIVDVRNTALVIGGGVAGLSAATFLSRMGTRVYLVEKERELGGMVKRLTYIWPVMKSGEDIVKGMVDELFKTDNVEILLSAKVVTFGGSFGNYDVTLNTPQGEQRIVVGGIIVAIGFEPFDPSIKKELCYGRDERIMTSLEFEEQVKSLSLQEKPKIGILQCIGSRDDTIGRPYCSRICCVNAIKDAEMIKRLRNDAYVECFYMDVRAHPKGGEEYYEDTMEKGVYFTRANVAEINPSKEGLVLQGEDTLLAQPFERVFDLVVLSTGMCPSTDNKAIASLLKISLDKDGFFLEAHPKLRPFDTSRKGIFIAGTCGGPKDVEESIMHGKASATKLYGLLNLGYTFVEPFVAFVDVNRCSGCRACETACLGKAIKFNEEKRVAYVEETSCVGCGLCNSICPSSAIQLKGYYFDNPIEEEVSALLEAI